MRGEGDPDRLPGEVGEALLDLGRVPVRGDAVGVDALGDLGEQAPLLGVAPGTADARLGVDDDARRSGSAARWSSGTSGSSAVVVKQPGLATSQRGADGVAIVLGQAVDRLPLQLQRLVRVAVGAARRAAGRAAGSRPRGRPPWARAAGRLDDRLRGRVRQAAEHDVERPPRRRRRSSPAAAGRRSPAAGTPRRSPCRPGARR